MSQIRIAGLNDAIGYINGVPGKLSRSVLLQMSQIAYDVAERGADRHTKTGGTGALRQSLFNRAIPKGREVGHDPQRAPHALFVNFGTRPHVIEPKNRKALRWAGGGKFFFAKRVNHPGYRGDAYIVEAAIEAIRLFRAAVDEGMKDTL